MAVASVARRSRPRRPTPPHRPTRARRPSAGCASGRYGRSPFKSLQDWAFALSLHPLSSPVLFTRSSPVLHPFFTRHSSAHPSPVTLTLELKPLPWT
eukprot:5369791-Prymnesium_polylepis.2